MAVVGGVGGMGRLVLGFQFPFTQSSRLYKVCYVRETAGRAACWGWYGAGWKTTPRSMRKLGQLARAG